MSTVFTMIVVVLGVVALLALCTVWFCMRCAKNVLHPVSKRKPLSAWPDQMGMPYENVCFKTADKVQLRGWFIPSATSIGYLELKDAAAAVQCLRDTRPQCCEKIGLDGLSMGGMVAICEAARNPEISCVVAEASYYSFRRVVSRWAWVHHKVPYFPLIPIILHYIRKYLGINPERYSPKYNIPKIAPRPVFIIHGRYDNLVPAAQAKMLFKKAGDPKEIWLVPGARHNKCAEVGGFEYKQRLADFFRQHL